MPRTDRTGGNADKGVEDRTDKGRDEVPVPRDGPCRGLDACRRRIAGSASRTLATILELSGT